MIPELRPRFGDCFVDRDRPKLSRSQQGVQPLVPYVDISRRENTRS
jgi:hypothetical protein